MGIEIFYSCLSLTLTQAYGHLSSEGRMAFWENERQLLRKDLRLTPFLHDVSVVKEFPKR